LKEYKSAQCKGNFIRLTKRVPIYCTALSSDKEFSNIYLPFFPQERSLVRLFSASHAQHKESKYRGNAVSCTAKTQAAI
jgi:hypothetical protein